MSATAHAPTRPKILAFIALMKLRIVELLLVTTVPTMIVAEGGLPSLWLIFATVFGGDQSTTASSSPIQRLVTGLESVAAWHARIRS